MTDTDTTTGDDEPNGDGASADDGTDREIASGSTVPISADLAAVALVTALASAAVTLPVVRSTPIRSVLAVPLVLFLPGYAIVAALFPEAGERAADGDETDKSPQANGPGLTYVERAALSFGVSVAVVPLTGLVLNVTPFGIQLAPVLFSVAGLTLAAAVLAQYRRLQLPPGDRFAVPYRQWGHSVVGVFSGHESNLDRALTVLTVLGLLLAVTSAGYAFAVPKEAGAFTELYLVTEQDDGDLIADDYPTEFVSGESKPLVVGVGNYEHRSVEYSLVVELQDATVENNSTQIHERDELFRQQLTLGDEETSERKLNVTPEMTGERLRLSFMLFKGDPPSSPTADQAYRETHLWISVSDGSQES
ncbi:DUF1616 domain-containing protein [Halorubrum kocurii]|uniref:DUF1616 domain-containing protein n=1 Tax=Halorubrum kocurii JCM 14978 TaxID=1230456 RepID=M0PMP5_9EURY|nr:DUF1616 domain-containing protein [Halorubrum kocurii]EMA70005.1 hypothetical protein C468_00680 [Halorubrum kocurii JCM 14978]